jgi:hypothetical protein
MANSFRNDQFRSSSLIGYITVGFLGLITFSSVLLVLSSFAALGFPDSGVELEDGAWMSFGLMAVGLVALADVGLRITTAVVFLIWINRAYKNLSALKARNLEFSPGWAVGWWFIPFANLVKPFQVVRELFNESDPDFDQDTGFLRVPAGTPFVIGLWWATYLISNISYRLSDMLYGKGDLPESQSFFVPLVAGAILSAISAGYAAYIVHAVIQRQEARAKIVAANSVNTVQATWPAPEFPQN